MDSIKKNPMELLGMKNKIPKIKILLDKINNKLDIAEEKISKVDHVAKIYP